MLLLGVVFGGAALVIVPPLVTFDAPGHYYRGLQTERFEFRPTRYSSAGLGGRLPERYVIFGETLWQTHWGKRDFGNLHAWRELSARAAQAHGRRTIEFTNIAVYSPANYTFQGISMGLAALASPSPLLSHIAGCCGNLLGYLLCVVLALERAPRFERGILLFASCPLLLIQAASPSADAINFCVPLLALTSVWRLREQAGIASRAALLVPLALGVFMAWLKPTTIVLLLCLAFIPVRHFGTTAKKWLVLGGVATLAAACWWWWNHPYFDLEMARWFEPQRPSAAVMRAWFREQPAHFLPALAHALRVYWWQQWPFAFGNVGGWVDADLQRCVLPLSLALGVALLGCDSGERHRDWTWAGGILLQSMAFFTLTALTLWLAYGTPGATVVPGLSGRYLFFVYLGLALAWAEVTRGVFRPWRRPFLWLGLGANATWLTILLVATAGKTWR